MDKTNLQEYFFNFYETFNKLSLEELADIAYDAKTQEEREFYGALINHTLGVNLRKYREIEKELYKKLQK